MKRLFKKIVYQIGKFFVCIGNKMMNWGDSYQTIYSKIYLKISHLPKGIKKKKGKLIEKALEIINETLDNTPIDFNFYNDYYELQKKHTLFNNDFISGITGVLTGITTSHLFYVLDKSTLKGEDLKKLENMLFVVCAALAVWMIVFVSSKFRGLDNHIINPYILEGMKKKIDEKEQNYKKPRILKKHSKKHAYKSNKTRYNVVSKTQNDVFR